MLSHSIHIIELVAAFGLLAPYLFIKTFDSRQKCFWDRQANFCYNIYQPCYECWSHLTHLPHTWYQLSSFEKVWSAVDWERQVVVIIHFNIHVILNMHSKKRLISSQIEFDELWRLSYPQKRKKFILNTIDMYKAPKTTEKNKGLRGKLWHIILPSLTDFS